MTFAPPDRGGDTIATAMVLAVTGGMLDAIVYLSHGHVFANAMTGNVVLLGAAAAAGDWSQAARHVVPIVAFLSGVVAAKACRRLSTHHAITLGLLFEIFALGVAGGLPEGFPQLPFVAIVALAAAFQVANFRRVRRCAYNSTFITGNLRTWPKEPSMRCGRSWMATSAPAAPRRLASWARSADAFWPAYWAAPGWARIGTITRCGVHCRCSLWWRFYPSAATARLNPCSSVVPPKMGSGAKQAAEKVEFRVKLGKAALGG